MFQWNWLSHYNYDFALAAIPIQLILLLFYCSRKNLPIRSSRSFLWVMIANLTMTVFDLIACEMIADWQAHPAWMLYLVNQIYFLAFIARGWALFDYTASECHGYSAFGESVSRLAQSPALAVIAAILSTPWTSAIFTISPDLGYRSGQAYQIIYYCTYFYIAASLLCIWVCWHGMDRRLKISMLGYNAILIASILLRKQFESTLLVMPYFSILVVLVIYLSAQNPDLYRDRKTHLFSLDAFDKIGREYMITKRPFHCIAITVNNVASVKTLYGQHQLERSMEIFGKWMTQHFPNYTVFYFGHGDFLLLSRGQAVQDRKALIRELKVRFERTWTSPKSEVPLSVSSMILTYGLIPKEITRALDFITYIFSRTYIENKRGNFVVSERIASEFDRGKLVESALSRALQEHRIEVYFQPIYSVREGRIIAAEALARLNDPQLGFVPPDEFIRVAERTGDIMEVGRQVVSQVCAFIAKEHPEQKGVHRISINLSPAQCMNDQLAAELSDIVESYGVPFSMISFEITESSIEDHYLIRKQMLTLKDRGANFSLDDFGTGTSNLVRLLDLPIGIVKFDRNLVNAYFSGKAKFLPDLVRMFQQAQMRIVTEGVETMEMLASLARMGCDFIQGYFFSKPVPYDQFMQYLNSGHAEKVAEELKSSTESRLIGKGAANL